MASCPVIRFTRTYTVLMLVGLCFVLPLIVVFIYPTDNPQPYVFEVRVTEKLGETLEGKLRYYRVEGIQGITPVEMFVVAIDSAYSRGGQSPDYVGSSIWMMGDLMTPEVYYGDQYLFYGIPQIYVSQVRTGWLWPDQVSGLTVLYGSPATTLLAPISMALGLLGEVPAFSLFILGFKSILVLVTAYLLDRYRKMEGSRTIIIIVYCLISILSTVPIMGDLY